MSYTNGLDKPSDYFETKLYTGTGSELSISSLDFSPDWVWVKQRGADASHFLYDSVRGATKSIRSNSTNAEATVAQSLKSFDSNGFTLGTSAEPNTSSGTYVGWNWKAGTSFTNDASATGIGSIDSAGSVNTDAGFSIVSYTGTGANATVGHGLNATPKMIIMKNLQLTTQWQIYHESIGNTHHLQFDTSAKLDDAGAFNDTSPTSSVFSLGASNYGNGNGNNMIAYCFAEKKGYSKFGSYTGNGNADGTFVYTGQKSAFVMIKATDATKGWVILDNKRNPSGLSGANTIRYRLFANTSAATSDNGDGHDFYSNGFKHYGTDTSTNQSGTNYIYMAFAENPFVTSTGVPATAR